MASLPEKPRLCGPFAERQFEVREHVFKVKYVHPVLSTRLLGCGRREADGRVHQVGRQGIPTEWGTVMVCGKGMGHSGKKVNSLRAQGRRHWVGGAESRARRLSCGWGW